jgi:hypothetical protein
MDNRELIRIIREAVHPLTSSSQPYIHAEALERYLDQLAELLTQEPAALDQLTVERAKAAHAFHLEGLKNVYASDLEMFRSVIASGQAALKASMTVNGAAATALLAFIGHLLTSTTTKGLIASFGLPMALFIGGVLVGTVAFGVNYLTQWLYTSKYSWCGNVCNLISILLVIASYLGFGWAAWLTYQLFRAF